MSNENHPYTSDEYVPWSRGAEELGIGRGSFYHLVDTGQVRELPGRHRRNRLFHLQDILAIKARRAEGKPRKQYRRKLPAVQVDWLRWDDLPACIRLDQIVYQENIDLGEISTYQAWRKKNQNTSIAVFDAKDRNICLGYVGLVPVSEQICLDVLSGKRQDSAITVDEIEAYDRSGPYILYAISAVVHPDRPDLLYTLLYHHMQFWIEQFPERYIKKIYAQAVSDEGERLVQHLFMAPRPDLNYNAYELDMARPSASKIIKRFKAQLQEKAPLPEALRWPPVQEPGKNL